MRATVYTHLGKTQSLDPIKAIMAYPDQNQGRSRTLPELRSCGTFNKPLLEDPNHLIDKPILNQTELYPQMPPVDWQNLTP